jgi:signal transduction histidine kinase
MFGIGLLIWLIVIPPYISTLLDRLGDAISKAQKADRSKNHFLANMSHELRTPLNAIIGYSEMVGEDLRENGQTEHAHDLKKIHDSGTQLLGLINEILDLSKIEAGRMHVFYEDIDVRELVSNVATTIQPLAEKNANQFKISVADEVSTLRADATKLRQILFNLLSNACKFTHDGHISLTVSKKSMTHHEANNECLAFKVADDGIGIAVEKIESIFLPFHQENLHTSKESGGTGLGLAISKRFCELMDGKLLVKSTKGEATTFTVLLPATSSG